MNKNKVCPMCGLNKNSFDFYISNKKISNYCKVCSRSRNKQYRKDNTEKIKELNLRRYYELSSDPEYNVERYQRNKSKQLNYRKSNNLSIKGRSYSLWDCASRRAKKKNLTFDISREDIENLFLRQNEKCSLTGIVFDYQNKYDSKFNPFSPSLDRINSKLGYTNDNIRLVLTCVNLAFNSWGKEFFDFWVREYIKKGKNEINREPS